MVRLDTFYHSAAYGARSLVAGMVGVVGLDPNRGGRSLDVGEPAGLPGSRSHGQLGQQGCTRRAALLDAAGGRCPTPPSCGVLVGLAECSGGDGYGVGAMGALVGLDCIRCGLDHDVEDLVL